MKEKFCWDCECEEGIALCCKYCDKKDTCTIACDVQDECKEERV